jgi:hypothetical protein
VDDPCGINAVDGGTGFNFLTGGSGTFVENRSASADPCRRHCDDRGSRHKTSASHGSMAKEPLDTPA